MNETLKKGSSTQIANAIFAYLSGRISSESEMKDASDYLRATMAIRETGDGSLERGQRFSWQNELDADGNIIRQGAQIKGQFIHAIFENLLSDETIIARIKELFPQFDDEDIYAIDHYIFYALTNQQAFSQDKDIHVSDISEIDIESWKNTVMKFISS